MSTNTCKKSCCWTPLGVCARQRTCPCHANDTTWRDIHQPVTAWDVAVEDARRQAEREESKRIEEFAPWR